MVDRGYCSACAPQHSLQAIAERARPSAHRRGYTRRWSEYSRNRLKRHPLCVGYPHGVHGARFVLATVTDHIEAAAKAPQLFWAPSNHQSLCDDCNKRKAIAEEGALAKG